MKINPIGINAYQQVSRTSNANRISNTNATNDEKTKNLIIKPRQGSLLPKISLSNAAAGKIEALSASERTALEHVINAIKAGGGSQSSYSRSEQTVNSPDAVGRIVDIKV